jgi:RNA polymerase sigma factor (sigma-70 family)
VDAIDGTSEPRATPDGCVRPDGANGADDAGLVRRAQAGDVAAFASLIERHRPALARFSRNVAGANGQAEDLVQEAVLRAFRALPRLGDPAKFAAWLFAIAANLSRRWRAQAARAPLSLEQLLAAYPDPHGASEGRLPAGPDDVFEAAERTRLLNEALNALPPPMARVIALHYLDGLGYADVAAALDVPVTTVKGRLFKSRRRLRRTLVALAPAAARTSPSGPARNRDEGGERTMAAEQQLETPGIVEVAVDSIRMNVLEPHRVVVLKETAGERYLPIVIGVPEADAIAIKLQNHTVPRPLTHDLFLSGLEATGTRVERVVITNVVDQTFFARIDLASSAGSRSIDARPSDGIALAVRCGAPIYVASTMSDQAWVQSLSSGHSRAAGSPTTSLKLSERAERATVRALEEARRFDHHYLGLEHLLLGVLVEGDSLAAAVLREYGVTLPNARQSLAVLVGFGERIPVDRPGGKVQLTPTETTPRYDRALQQADAEAGERGRDHIGTEHLLLAALQEDKSMARRILAHVGADPDLVRASLRAKIDADPESVSASSQPEK